MELVDLAGPQAHDGCELVVCYRAPAHPLHLLSSREHHLDGLLLAALSHSTRSASQMSEVRGRASALQRQHRDGLRRLVLRSDAGHHGDELVLQVARELLLAGEALFLPVLLEPGELVAEHLDEGRHGCGHSGLHCHGRVARRHIRHVLAIGAVSVALLCRGQVVERQRHGLGRNAPGDLRSRLLRSVARRHERRGVPRAGVVSLRNVGGSGVAGLPRAPLRRIRLLLVAVCAVPARVLVLLRLKLELLLLSLLALGLLPPLLVLVERGLALRCRRLRPNGLQRGLPLAHLRRNLHHLLQRGRVSGHAEERSRRRPALRRASEQAALLGGLLRNSRGDGVAHRVQCVAMCERAAHYDRAVRPLLLDVGYYLLEALRRSDARDVAAIRRSR
mmetsp:Transcript_18525/g.71523  ORF Transcript_18525/g.71523 Transcript_18525/m.71523 type:complete len:390 (+) Transcript_18525:1860-3029(+)